MKLFRRRRVLLPGPVLIGFSDLFDRSYGDPKTPRPYPKVTPSRVGGVLLPFQCPHCAAVRPEVIDSKKRDWYYDRERSFSWCPACQGRYVINPTGMPLKASLPAEAAHAPALIERNGDAKLLGEPREDGLDVLGVL